MDDIVTTKWKMDDGLKKGLSLEEIFNNDEDSIEWCKLYLKLKEDYYRTGKISFDDVYIDKEYIQKEFKIIYNYINTDDIGECEFTTDKWIFYDLARFELKTTINEDGSEDRNYEYCPDVEFYDYDIKRWQYFHHIFYGFWDKIDRWHSIKDMTHQLSKIIRQYYIDYGYELDYIQKLLLKDNGEYICKDIGYYSETYDYINKKPMRIYRLISDYEEKRLKINYENIVNNSISSFKKYINDYKEDSFPLVLATKYIDNLVSELIKKKKETLYCFDEYDNSELFRSNDEKEIYKKLCSMFGKDDILKEYVSQKYPWHCDFYIKSKGLFIEYQGTWQHFGEPYINSLNQKIRLMELINKIKDKSNKKQKDAYYTAINTWTVKDVAKRKWAKDNNLNWIEFFTIDEFDKWIEVI